MVVQQERAARTRRALLGAAAAEFDRYGYTQAKLTEISGRAGVSPGALHFHFDSKAAVAAAVEDAAFASLRRSALTARRLNSDALQGLVDTSHVLARLLCWDVLARAGFRLATDLTRVGYRDFRHEWGQCVGALIARADQDGLLASDAQLPALVCTVVAATTGMGMLVSNSGERRTRLALTGLWQAVLPSLAKPLVLDRLDPAGRYSVVEDAFAAAPGGRSDLATTGSA